MLATALMRTRGSGPERFQWRTDSVVERLL